MLDLKCNATSASGSVVYDLYMAGEAFDRVSVTREGSLHIPTFAVKFDVRMYTQLVASPDGAPARQRTSGEHASGGNAEGSWQACSRGSRAHTKPFCTSAAPH